MKGTKKKQRMALGLSVFILCIMYLAVLVVSVKAEEKSVTVKIPVTCTGTNTTERFTVELEGGDSEYEQVQEKTLELSDGEEKQFVVTCHYPGTYHYTVRQKAGTDEKTTYDDTTYQVDVYVTENEQGALGVTPVAYVKGQTEKLEKLSYQNSREKPETPGEPETPEEPAEPEKPEEEPKKESEKPVEKQPEPTVVTQVQTVAEPKTGDTSRLWIWGTGTVTGFGIMVALGGIRKKQRGRKDA